MPRETVKRRSKPNNIIGLLYKVVELRNTKIEIDPNTMYLHRCRDINYNDIM
jgi:membrane protein CcdC involved in cytochrome C biogenesis